MAMDLQSAINQLGESVRDREVAIGNEVWAALEAAGLARYARLSAGIEGGRQLPAPEIVTRKNGRARPGRARPGKKPKAAKRAKVTDAQVSEVKQQIRMGGAKTAFIESIAEEGPQPASTVIAKTLDRMVEAGVVKVSDRQMVSFTDLGRKWFATFAE